MGYIPTMELITVSKMEIWTSLSCVCTLHSMYMCVFACQWLCMGVSGCVESVVFMYVELWTDVEGKL